MPEKLTANSQISLEMAIEVLREVYANDHYVVINYETGKQRTPQQRKSLEVYCRLLADALNGAGYDMKLLLEKDPEYELPWNQASVKEHLWRPIMLAMTGKESTTQCDRKEYGQIYDVLTYNLGTKLGITVMWPEKDSQQ